MGGAWLLTLEVVGRYKNSRRPHPHPPPSTWPITSPSKVYFWPFLAAQHLKGKCTQKYITMELSPPLISPSQFSPFTISLLLGRLREFRIGGPALGRNR